MHTPQDSHSSSKALTPISLHSSITLRICFIYASILSGMSVALQAIAAHLPDPAFLTPNGRPMVLTAANLALWHSIALCALTIGASYLHPVRIRIACLGMIVGTILFSTTVTLYGLRIIHTACLAPWGGSLLILSWLITASAATKRHFLR